MCGNYSSAYSPDPYPQPGGKHKSWHQNHGDKRDQIHGLRADEDEWRRTEERLWVEIDALVQAGEPGDTVGKEYGIARCAEDEAVGDKIAVADKQNLAVSFLIPCPGNTGEWSRRIDFGVGFKTV